MEIPTALAGAVRDGRVVLLLGAGASMGARDADGNRPLSGRELATRIVDEFLTPAHADRDLATAAELAISESSLGEVQDFIASLFVNLQPSRGHALLPTFRWRGLVTTNYDRLVEEAYERESDPSQRLSPVISNEDSMDDALRGTDRLALLKLHGCITRTRDQRTPLTLTPDQYVTHRKYRDRLFRSLTEWGYENTIVAIGQRLQDADLRQVLLELSEMGLSRPRYYYVSPEGSPEEARFWDGKRISTLTGTFDEFLTALDESLGSPLRRVVTVDPEDAHPLVRRLNATLSAETQDYLADHVDYVHAGLQVSGVSPADFYRGFSPGWGSIEQNLDVRRRLVDTVLFDVILPDETDRRSVVEFYAIRAEAGAGKSICLRRIAWESATAADRVCLYLRPEGDLTYEPIAEIVHSVGGRLFLFVDNAARRAAELRSLLVRARRDGLPITVITAERQNEWNIYCERLDDHLTDSFPLRYLNEPEILELLGLLGRHKALGYLEPLSAEERVQAFVQRAGRQLLVALLEATQGLPFEDILIDEFRKIEPEAAQSLYLTVCVLNRLDIPVRAGLISRVHGIPFTEFRENLFKPLEHVVMARDDKRIQDHVYYARHSLIAQVVFERILNSPPRRFDEYLRLLQSLNLSYDTDLIAFRSMVRGRLILELFPNYQDATAIFEAALALAPDDAPLLHQRGVWEMNRADGNLTSAHDFLNLALQKAPLDLTIVHSLAELERKRADQSPTDMHRRRFRSEARRLASIVRDDPVHGPFGYHTIIKTYIDQLTELLADGEPGNAEIDRLLQDVEETLDNALQRFPEDEFMLSAEAELANLLHDDDRAYAALDAAFKRNQRSPFIATRLARVLDKRGQTRDALEVLHTAVDANPADQRLHFSYAMMLRESPENDASVDTMLHHLRRSFTPGDRKLDAQFWFGTYLYLNGTAESIEQSREVFRALWMSPLPYRVKATVREMYRNPDGSEASFTGTVNRLNASSGWIVRDGTNDRIMVREQNLDPEEWRSLSERGRVRFAIGFCFGGPVALTVREPNER